VKVDLSFFYFANSSLFFSVAGKCGCQEDCLKTGTCSCDNSCTNCNQAGMCCCFRNKIDTIRLFSYYLGNGCGKEGCKCEDCKCAPGECKCGE